MMVTVVTPAPRDGARSSVATLKALQRRHAVGMMMLVGACLACVFGISTSAAPRCATPPIPFGKVRFDPLAPTVGKNSKKYVVQLLKDQEHLGEAGDIVRVRRGHYRNWLYPEGIAQIIDTDFVGAAQMAEKQKRQKEQADKSEAQRTKRVVEEGKYVFERSVRGGTDTKIYGGIGVSQMVEEIEKQTQVRVAATSVQIPKVSELGKYSCTVKVAEGVSAFLEFYIVKPGEAETFFDKSEDDAEGDEAEEEAES